MIILCGKDETYRKMEKAFQKVFVSLVLHTTSAVASGTTNLYQNT